MGFLGGGGGKSGTSGGVCCLVLWYANGRGDFL